MIDEPSAGQHYGGAGAAPVFSKVTGAALRLLTDDAENQATLATSLRTLTRVLDAVERQMPGHGHARRPSTDADDAHGGHCRAEML